ncbi:hypothetical protein [Streptomyces griseosporeus]|uniref:DUF6197 family protein n=1 Tax=Streptomyces griseosporeus TaxID=1910 RepID=UPI0036FE23AE
MTTIAAPAASPPRPLTFDERLALAALAIDARIATAAVDLADVVRIPIDTPRPAATPYSTPIADLLHRARLRIETDGWSREALVEEDGRRCAIGAIRREAASRGQADGACVLLLEAIQRHWQAETIPSWNAAQASPAPVLLAFAHAAELAHNRNL